MSAPRQPAAAGGLLLVSARPNRVAAWVRRGLVATRVIPLGRWTAVVPVRGATAAHPPYDDAVTVLAARPLPHSLRPAVGLWAVDGRAVVTVSPRVWRAGQRWLIWQPGEGVLVTPDLQPATPAQLARVAGRPTARDQVLDRVRDPQGSVHGLLLDLLAVLDLPGTELLAAGPGDQGFVVGPTGRTVERFEARVAEEARHRREMEGH